MASDETIVGTPEIEARQVQSNVITTFGEDDALEIFQRKDTFTSGLDQGRTTIITDPLDAGNLVLSAEFEAGTRGHVQWQSDLGGAQESATLEYRFMFVDQGNGFDFQRGGKLPGLAGGTAPTGGQPADDGLGFSARFNWIERSISSPDTNLSAYVYDMAGEQDHLRLSYAEPTRSRSQPNPTDPDDAIVLEDGRWYAIKQQIVMNTPGQADGVLPVWLDDKLALEVTDMEMRSSSDVGIDMLYFSTFFGGPDTPEWQAAKDERIYYDDFRVTLEDGSIVNFDIDAGAPITSPPSPAGDEAEAGAEALAEAEDGAGSPAPGTAEAGAGTKSPADADAAGGAAVPDIASDITSDEGTPSVTASSVVDPSTPASDDVTPIVVNPLLGENKTWQTASKAQRVTAQLPPADAAVRWSRSRTATIPARAASAGHSRK
jgi:hypothetical protein